LRGRSGADLAQAFRTASLPKTEFKTFPLTTPHSMSEASFIPSVYGRAANAGGKRNCVAVEWSGNVG